MFVKTNENKNQNMVASLNVRVAILQPCNSFTKSAPNPWGSSEFRMYTMYPGLGDF